MLKHFIVGSVVSLSLLFTSACGGNENNGEVNQEEEGEKTEVVENDQEAQKSTAFPVEITDASGEEVVIEEKPERIVSILPSNTEIAFALGLGEEIVGVTDYDDYPEEAKEKESVGGLDFNMETLISLEPDLVLARESSSPGGSEEAYEQIEEAGIDVLVVNSAASFEEVYESIELIGQATGTNEEASTIISDMKEDIADIEEQAQAISEDERKTVWVEIQPPPNIYTTGKGTFIHSMLETIQADNAAGDEEGWLPYSEEEAVALNPDVILTTYGESVEDFSIDDIKARDGWGNVPAVENDEIYDMNNDIVSRPAPRLVKGIEKMAELVYPDVFAEE